MERVVGRVETFSKYVVFLAVLSFLGWMFETIYVYLYAGRVKDAGFMSLPFCPIYAFTLLSVYFLGGTPKQPKGILKGLPNVSRQLGYWALAFLTPSVFELFIGFTFDKVFGLRLWNYQGQRFNYNGYVALFVSLQWSALIFLTMQYIFPFLKRKIFSLQKNWVVPLSVFLLIIGILDITYNFIRL